MPWEVLCSSEHDPVTTDPFGVRPRTLPRSCGKSMDEAIRGPSIEL